VAIKVGITPLDLLKEWGALFVAVVAVVYSIVSSKQNKNFLEKLQNENIKFHTDMFVLNSLSKLEQAKLDIIKEDI